MNTQCNATKLTFHELDSREVVGRFDGGEITSDAGGVLLREVEKRTGILGRMVECFDDHRDPERIGHTVESLVKQRVMGLCLGYEDLNDHDELCRDRMMALLCESDDMKGERRHKESDRGKALAGKSTLNRMEMTPWKESDGRYKKIPDCCINSNALVRKTPLYNGYSAHCTVRFMFTPSEDELHRYGTRSTLPLQHELAFSIAFYTTGRDRGGYGGTGCVDGGCIS